MPLGGEQLAERRLGLDGRLEGVVLARWSRVLDQLLLDDALDVLAVVRKLVPGRRVSELEEDHEGGLSQHEEE